MSLYLHAERLRIEAERLAGQGMPFVRIVGRLERLGHDLAAEFGGAALGRASVAAVAHIGAERAALAQKGGAHA